MDRTIKPQSVPQLVGSAFVGSNIQTQLTYLKRPVVRRANAYVIVVWSWLFTSPTESAVVSEVVTKGGMESPGWPATPSANTPVALTAWTPGSGGLADQEIQELAK